MATQKKTKKKSENKTAKRTYSNISITGDIVEDNVETLDVPVITPSDDSKFTFNDSTYLNDEPTNDNILPEEEETVIEEPVIVNTPHVIDYEYLELEQKAKEILSIPEDKNMSHSDWLRELIKVAEYAKNISIAHKQLHDKIVKSKILSSSQPNGRWT